MIGWGTTYQLPILLGGLLGHDLGLAPEIIFGGLTIMLVTSALLAPRFGKLVDRLGPRSFLCAGSLAAAIGLATLSYGAGLATYVFAWILFGFALATTLGAAAQVALARVAGPQARRAISALLVFTAVNPFIFYPLTTYLSGAIGWRTMCLLYASAHLFICLPLHYLVGSLPAADAAAGAADGGDDEERDGTLPHDQRRGALTLLVIAFAGGSFILWGMSPHLVNMFGALGVPNASAVFFASLIGPWQIAGRLVNFGFAARLSPLALAIFAAALAPPALAALIFAGQHAIFAIVGIGMYGVSVGLGTVARSAIPLNLFGRSSLGATLGRITRPVNIVCAAAPIAFASLIARIGPGFSLMIGVTAGAIALAAFVMLQLRTRTPIYTG